MTGNFDRCLQLVLAHEGGFVDHPKDPGGATNKGVTLKTYRSFYGQEKTVDDLKNISDGELAHIYTVGYWTACSCNELPLGVDYVVFDQAVNSGPTRSARWLQAAVEMQIIDGVIGEKTIWLVNRGTASKIITAMCKRRRTYLLTLKTFPTFGKGWLDRVDAVERAAMEMSIEATTTTT